MWDAFIAWRAEYKVDTILTEFKFHEEKEVMEAY
jgi:hypothetical protein